MLDYSYLHVFVYQANEVPLYTAGSGEAVSGFVEFMYEHILSACFAAPLKSTFDLNDGHASLVSLL